MLTKKNSKRRIIVGLTVLLAVMFFALQSSPAVATTDWNVGDLALGVDGGQYQIRDNTGVLKDTIQPGGLGGFTTGCAWNPALDRLYTTNFGNTKVIAVNDAQPHADAQTINTAAVSPAGHSESIVFAADGSFYVGHPDGNRLIHHYAANGILIATFDVTSFGPGLGGIDFRGTDWIDLSADQETLFYTSEGRKIQRINTDATNNHTTPVGLPPFATLPGSGYAYALRLLPPGDGSGGLLVADQYNVKHLAGDGTLFATYDVTFVGSGVNENTWFSLNLDPDGVHFWAGNFGTNNVYRFPIKQVSDFTTDTQNRSFNTGGTLFGICLKGEPTAATVPVAVEKDYRFTNVCFEEDNDLDRQFSEDPIDFDADGNPIDNDVDGLFNEDGIDCPEGTDTGQQLPQLDPEDTESAFVVKAQLKKKDGTVTSYNPGQYYAVSTVEVLQDLDLLWISELYGECTDPEDGDPISVLNPPPGEGGGNVVLVELIDGVAFQIADSNSLLVNITDADDDGVPDDAEAHLENVQAGQKFLLYVKFGPGLKGKTLPPATMCENENIAQAVVVDGEAGEPIEVGDTATLTVLPKEKEED